MLTANNPQIFEVRMTTGNEHKPPYTIIGDKRYPTPRQTIRSEHLLQEETWKAWRHTGGKWFFEFQASRQGGGTDRYEISEAEFVGLKSGDLKFDDLIRLTDFDPSRLPLK